MATNIVELTGDHLSYYRSAPATALKKWSQIEDTIFLDGASYILAPDRFKQLLASPLLVSNFRAVSSPDCLGTQTWAMYKEGSVHHFSRNAAVYRVGLCLKWLNELSLHGGHFVQSSGMDFPDFVKDLLIRCYADVFGVARLAISVNYQAMLELHHFALRGNVSGVNEVWKMLRAQKQLKRLDDSELSLLIFFVSDTASSIVHLSLINLRDNCNNNGELDYSIRSQPPFLYSVRVARKGFSIDDLHIEEGRRLLIPLVSENYHSAIPFGFGSHKCPGRGLAFKLAQYIRINGRLEDLETFFSITSMTQFLLTRGR